MDQAILERKKCPIHKDYIKYIKSLDLYKEIDDDKLQMEQAKKSIISYLKLALSDIQGNRKVAEDNQQNWQKILNFINELIESQNKETTPPNFQNYYNTIDKTLIEPLREKSIEYCFVSKLRIYRKSIIEYILCNIDINFKFSKVNDRHIEISESLLNIFTKEMKDYSFKKPVIEKYWTLTLENHIERAYNDINQSYKKWIDNYVVELNNYHNHDQITKRELNIQNMGRNLAINSDFVGPNDFGWVNKIRNKLLFDAKNNIQSRSIQIDCSETKREQRIINYSTTPQPSTVVETKIGHKMVAPTTKIIHKLPG